MLYCSLCRSDINRSDHFLVAVTGGKPKHKVTVTRIDSRVRHRSKPTWAAEYKLTVGVVLTSRNEKAGWLDEG